MSAATVSVVIPTYNGSRYLRESVTSVRKQTVSDVEIIVVDDASSDGTYEACRSDPCFAGVRLFRHAVNLGPGESRRTGIRAATGAFISFLDADDVLEPRFLKASLDVMHRHPTVGLCCCDGLLIDGSGEVLYEGRTFNAINAAMKRYPLKTGIRELEEIFLFSTIGIGFLVRREVFERVSYPAGRRLEDYQFQFDVAANGFHVFYLNEPLARYRMHEDNASGAAAGAGMSEELVAFLHSVRTKYSAVRKLGSRARQRVADARMDLGIAYLKTGFVGRGCRTLVRAIAEYPPQLVALARFARRFLARRAFA